MSSEPTHFLNVDLELTTRGEIAPLLAQWSKKIVVLRDSTDDGVRTIWLEVVPQQRGVEGVLLTLLDMVEKLPADARDLWNSCEDRCFNVGIQAGSTPHDSTYSISPETLAQIASVMARVAFTVYAPLPTPDA